METRSTDYHSGTDVGKCWLSGLESEGVPLFQLVGVQLRKSNVRNKIWHALLMVRGLGISVGVAIWSGTASNPVFDAGK